MIVGRWIVVSFRKVLSFSKLSPVLSIGEFVAPFFRQDLAMMTSPEMLQLLRCPETGSELKFLSTDDVEVMNEKVRARELHNRIGKVIEEPIDSAISNEDGSWVYVIREGIVSLIVDQAISGKQLKNDE